ncbi:MAG: acylphosphatase [Pseudomonas sp.]|nr:acylphosphatase [Pseudomonas sp.]MDZ4350461.1 acylphosphatase [Xanthomonadaceae bacterium]
MAAARFWISGRVQGLFYRASARAEALKLGLTGHAENLPDGRVQVLAEGDPAALDALERWLRQGPPAAEVASVIRAPTDPQGSEGFRIG